VTVEPSSARHVHVRDGAEVNRAATRVHRQDRSRARWLVWQAIRPGRKASYPGRVERRVQGSKALGAQSPRFLDELDGIVTDPNRG